MYPQNAIAKAIHENYSSNRDKRDISVSTNKLVSFPVLYKKAPVTGGYYWTEYSLYFDES